MSALVPAIYAQNNDVITLFGYLHVFPNDLGEFDSEPKTIIANINDNAPYGYCTWRIPTKEELSLLISNNIVSSGTTYMSSGGGYSSGRVRLVTDDVKCTEIKIQKAEKAKQMKTQGVISGVFTINREQKVHFSQGNLQYNVSTKTWRFAENQYDIIGEANLNMSSMMDLFSWGGEPTKHYNDFCHMPFNDRGYNKISNGSGRNWRTLTEDEWLRVVYWRETASGIRFAKAQVNGIDGLILLPDDWKKSIYNLTNANIMDANYASNIISRDVWVSTFEANGAVFLPCAGICDYEYNYSNKKWRYVYYNGFGYWSSTEGQGCLDAQCFDFYRNPNGYLRKTGRNAWRSVRVVCPVDK